MINEDKSAASSYDGLPSSTVFRHSVSGMHPSRVTEPVRRLFGVSIGDVDSSGRLRRFLRIMAGKSINDSQLIIIRFRTGF